MNVNVVFAQNKTLALDLHFIYKDLRAFLLIFITCTNFWTFFSSTVLPSPQISSTSSSSNDSITVSWAPVNHAVQYTLSIYKLGSNTNMKHNTSNTNMTMSGLDAGSLYVIKALAWDPEGRKGEGTSYINQKTRKKALWLKLWTSHIRSHMTADGHTLSPITVGPCGFVIICEKYKRLKNKTLWSTILALTL